MFGLNDVGAPEGYGWLRLLVIFGDVRLGLSHNGSVLRLPSRDARGLPVSYGPNAGDVRPLLDPCLGRVFVVGVGSSVSGIGLGLVLGVCIMNAWHPPLSSCFPPDFERIAVILLGVAPSVDSLMVDGHSQSSVRSELIPPEVELT